VSNIRYLYEYKWFIVFFVCWDNINTAESVEILAKDRDHAERIFRERHQPFYEPLYIDDLLIIETTDYLD